MYRSVVLNTVIVPTTHLQNLLYHKSEILSLGHSKAPFPTPTPPGPDNNRCLRLVYEFDSSGKLVQLGSHNIGLLVTGLFRLV